MHNSINPGADTTAVEKEEETNEINTEAGLVREVTDPTPETPGIVQVVTLDPDQLRDRGAEVETTSTAPAEVTTRVEAVLSTALTAQRYKIHVVS